jgi:hypothetical protein
MEKTKFFTLPELELRPLGRPTRNDRKGSVAKKKTLVVILKILGAKTNWLVVNGQSQSNCDSD